MAVKCRKSMVTLPIHIGVKQAGMNSGEGTGEGDDEEG